MTNPARRITGLALAALAAVGLAAASRAPWRAHPDPAGLVRVSLGARPERIESCRTLTPEELADIPSHMRQEVVCEGTAARYRLVVELGGRTVASQVLSGGGARQDRPVHALLEFPLPAGRHHLSVRWDRADSLPSGATAPKEPAGPREPGLSRERGERESEERDRRRREAVPARMALDTVVEVAARRVILVTYDPVERRLLAIAAPRTP